MKPNYYLTLFFLFIFSTLSLSSTAAPVPYNANWKLVSQKDGIKIYEKEIKNQDLLAFKGEAVVNANIAKIAQVLGDNSRKIEWAPNIEKATTLRTLSFYERIEFSHTNTPWPLKDRDFVFKANIKLDQEKKQLKIFIKSIPFKDLSRGENVRGELNQTIFTVKSIGDGSKSLVSFEVFADPKGSIPNWVANIFQKDWPRKTLEGLRKQVKKSDVLEHQFIKDYFKQKSS